MVGKCFSKYLLLIIDILIGKHGGRGREGPPTSKKETFLVPRYYYVVEVLKEYPELSRGAY